MSDKSWHVMFQASVWITIPADSKREAKAKVKAALREGGGAVCDLDSCPFIVALGPKPVFDSVEEVD